MARMRDYKCVQNFNREPERKRPLERPRRRSEDNIKVQFKNICGLD
jgi:hypothetical protein